MTSCSPLQASVLHHTIKAENSEGKHRRIKTRAVSRHGGGEEDSWVRGLTSAVGEDGERKRRREVRTACSAGRRECSALGVSCTLWLGVLWMEGGPGGPMDGGSTQSHALHLVLGLVFGGGTDNLFRNLVFLSYMEVRVDGMDLGKQVWRKV